MKAIAETLNKMPEAKRQLSFALEFSNFQSQLDFAREAKRYFLDASRTYFPSRDFLLLREPLKGLKESVAARFADRLNALTKGREQWQEFQNLCKEILMYLFVPPLVGPFEQTRTENSLHIRDLVFDIPYSVSDFWGYIRDRFSSSAVVVECKNYSSPIDGNQNVISSKYLGKTKLGGFGIVISRFDPARSAVKETKRLWIEDSKLILCLTDIDLIRMLKIREKNEDSGIVIDNAIHAFLRRL